MAQNINGSEAFDSACATGPVRQQAQSHHHKKRDCVRYFLKNKDKPDNTIIATTKHISKQSLRYNALPQ
jgi:hypothetical protein